MTAFELLTRCKAAGVRLTPTADGIRADGPMSAIEAFDAALKDRHEDVRALIMEHGEAKPVLAAERLITRRRA
jgi:hypothetical protein